MSTTTFKANLNSVSIRFQTGVAELKHSITTCIQRWRIKLPLKKRKKHQQTHKEDYNCPNNFTNKGHSFVQRTVYCKTFEAISQQFSSLQQQQAGIEDFTFRNASKGPRKYGRKVEIVAKLLSATFIDTVTTEDSSQQTDSAFTSSFADHIEFIKSSTKTLSSTTNNNDAMTITDLTFLELREEYPDLDKEIRSILNSRAQDGATISEIRDDYRKLTGLKFPIYDEVTEFLLSIPYVSAYCNEKGTRIFNIRPMDKTKHIHDMVVNQKPPQEPVHRYTNNRYYYRERQRSQNYHPYNWRHNTSNRQLRTAKTYAESNTNMDKQNHPQQRKQAVISTDNNLSRDDSEGFVENNWCYTDNCNYLYNRICNQQPPVSQMILNPHSNNVEQPQTVIQPTTTSTVLNNYNANIPPSYENNINHLNKLFQQQQQTQQNQNINTNNMGKQHPPHLYSLQPFQSGIPRSSRSSSPTNNSAITDSDYEAHLLDFLLLGDDFLLYMARMELRCKFKKDKRILQSGLCVSGQTIGGAIKRIRVSSDNRRSIILNIGSVDIMQGKQLIQVEHDFRDLISLMLKKGIKPILTTLAPLANYSHDNEVKGMLERFNEFIKREGQKRNLVVIDIWKCLVNEKGQVFFDCYQNEPRTVTGTSEPYLFWNKIGRQRVLQLIESKLEY